MRGVRVTLETVTPLFLGERMAVPQNCAHCHSGG